MDGDALHDLDAEALQGWDVFRVVGEQADFADAEVGDDLAAEAYLAEDALVGGAEGFGFGAAGGAVDAELRGVRRAIDGEAALGVVEIDEGTDAGLRYLAEARVDGGAAVAGSGAEDVAGEAVGVDADQDRLAGPGSCVEVAEGKGYVGFVAGAGLDGLDVAFVGEHAEIAVLGGENALRDAVDVALVGHAVADEVGYGDHFEGVKFAELDEVGNAGHGAVFVHDLADDAGGDEAGHAGEVDGSFGLAGADEDSAFAGAEGKDVAGTGKVVGRRVRVDGYLNRMGTVGCGDAGGDAFAGLDGLGERGAEARGVVLGHGTEAHVVGALFGEGEADESAAEAGHEVDGFGGAELGGDGEVAFVFAVFVVDEDDHATGFELFEGFGDVDKSSGAVSHRRVGGTPLPPKSYLASNLFIINGLLAKVPLLRAEIKGLKYSIETA